jgi:hypothetical protein
MGRMEDERLSRSTSRPENLRSDEIPGIWFPTWESRNAKLWEFRDCGRGRRKPQMERFLKPISLSNDLISFLNRINGSQDWLARRASAHHRDLTEEPNARPIHLQWTAWSEPSLSDRRDHSFRRRRFDSGLERRWHLRIRREFCETDEATEALIRHPGIAEPVIEGFGKPAAAAMNGLNGQNARRLAMMVDDGSLAKIPQQGEV